MTPILHLLMVHPEFRDWGSGHDVAFHRLAAALAARPGVAVTVVTAWGRVRGPVPPGVTLVRLPCVPVWRGGLLFHSFRLAWRLARRFCSADAVYLGSPLLEGGDMAMVQFVSLDWLEQGGGVGSTLRRLHDRWRHGLAARLERRVYPAPDRAFLLPVSQALKDRLERRFGPLPRCRVCANPADTARFRPTPDPVFHAALLEWLGWPENSALVLFVGGAWHRKRLDRALEALALLPEHIRLLVAGAGPQAEYRRRAESLGVAGRVAFLGPRRDMPRLMPLGAALVFPSDYETDGLVAWEALACGVPVVAAPVDGSEAWLVEGVTGYAARTPAEIAAAVRRLLTTPLDPEPGRALAETRTPSHIAAEVEALARTLAEGRMP